MKVIHDELHRIVQEMNGTADIVLTRPEPQFGDYSTNAALQLSKQVGQNPRDIAQEIADKLTALPEVKTVDVAGPGFINISVTDEALLRAAQDAPERFRDGETIVIETNNPNPFKAMHIGHAFNAIVADAIANLLQASGAAVYRVSYHGDVGLHVGKSMYSLLRYVNGNVDKLTEVPEHERNSFMSRMYAEGSRAYKDDESARAEIDQLAKQSFTREDPVYAAVYDICRDWSFEQIDELVARLGNTPIERRFLESDADMRGVKIVRDNTPGVFQESDGALIFRGSEHGSFDNVFVGKNGMGLYGARDMGLIQLKNEQYHPDHSYIVTAEEQRDYFQGVLAAVGLVWPELAGVTVNIPTGTVKLTTGKMSSRDGDVIEVAWLFDQIAQAIIARGGEPTEDVVAGALRYAFLRVRIGSDVVFDINESVSIQGNSGPYLQYAHARAASIIQKASEVKPTEVKSLDEAERALVRKLSEYADIVDRSMRELMPHHICHYLYELAQEFNRFYEQARILDDPRGPERLTIVMQYRDTLAGGLGLLGITAPDTM